MEPHTLAAVVVVFTQPLAPQELEALVVEVQEVTLLLERLERPILAVAVVGLMYPELVVQAGLVL